MEPTKAPKLATYIVARNASALVEYIEKGLGGKLSYREVDRDNRIVHAEVRIEDGLVMIGEAPQGRSPFPAMLHLYVQDSDAAYRRALEAGATAVRPPTDAPDGHRRGGVKDGWGNEWWFSSQIRKT